jgi:outer membrane protein OmpA-like peptidoglycan-associated protein/tetratricopeptide (TPR) repeat protein
MKLFSGTLLYVLASIFILMADKVEGQAIVSIKDLKSKEKKLYEEARKQKFREPQTALNALDKILEKEPLFIDGYLEVGSIHYNVGQYESAFDFFLTAYRLDSLYNPKIINSLALSAWHSGKYEDALHYFQQYKYVGNLSEDALYATLQNIENAKFAAEAIKTPVPFEPIPLGPAINSSYPDYMPKISVDGNLMIFHRRIAGREDFYYSLLNSEGEWQEAKPLEELNTSGNEGAHSLSPDGKTIYFTICDSPKNYGSCDIYYSQHQEGHWSPPVNLGTNVNSKSWDAQPSISSDGRFLFFSSNRPNGYGNKDIYVCFKRQNGSWSQAKNLGQTINTKGDEEAPFIHADGMSLYFMSNGHPNFGSSDLFLSRTTNYIEWTSPINLGYPINTKDKEGALFVSADGKTGYFSKEITSNLPGDKKAKKGDIDIYFFEIPEHIAPKTVGYIKAIVLDALTMQPLQAKVNLKSLDSRLFDLSANTTKKGEILSAMPTFGNIGLFVEAEGYLYYSENFQIDSPQPYSQPTLKKILLFPLSSPSQEFKRETFVLENIFFDSNEAILQDGSFDELNRLLTLLTKQPKLKIEITGHSDNIGEFKDNLALSKARAEAVADYLISKGIAESRVTFRGLADQKPVAENDTEEGRALNRRTEFSFFE